ncbi:MAG: hypothetical protein ACLUEV_11280 [Alistipes sp.]
MMILTFGVIALWRLIILRFVLLLRKDKEETREYRSGTAQIFNDLPLIRSPMKTIGFTTKISGSPYPTGVSAMRSAGRRPYQ